MLTTDQLATFRKHGWIILPEYVPVDFMKEFWTEFNTLVNLARGMHGFSIVTNALAIDSLLELAESHRSGLGAVYRSCRHLGSLQRLLLSNEFLILAKTVMGTPFLNVCPYTATRIDLRGEEEYLFDWHQDYPYIQGSMNGIVLWIPLSTVQLEGAVEILDGSHAAGLRPVFIDDPTNNNKNGAKTMRMNPKDEVFTSYESVIPSMKLGDLLLFSTLLVHRSVPQLSIPVRVTTQFRYGDFTYDDSVRRGWPVGTLEGRGFEEDHSEYVLRQGL